MAPTFNNMLARRELGDSDTFMDLLITFLGLAFFALILVAILVAIRRWKRQQYLDDEALPAYEDVKGFNNRGGQLPSKLTIQGPDGRPSILVINGSRPMLADPNSPPYSPNNIPEIHITFPDEHDEEGRKKQNGRVMIVRVGETQVGLEPVRDEQLPVYEKDSKHEFYSIDMDQIGGLKEKDRSQFQ
jgi:hypothetical protein